MFDYSVDQSFNNELKKSKYIKFLPYIGKEYKNEKTRILILGESHYIRKEDFIDLKKNNEDENFTRRIFLECYFPGIREDGIHQDAFIKCFRYTAAMITGKDYYSSDNIWQKLAFYNFFQTIAGVGSKDKQFITKDVVNNSRNAFYDIVNILKPDLVIVWGKGKLFYEWMPNDDWEYVDKNKICYIYKHYPSTIMWHIRHPSLGFSYKEHNEVYLEIISVLNSLKANLS